MPRVLLALFLLGTLCPLGAFAADKDKDKDTPAPVPDPPELLTKREEYLRTLQRAQAPVFAGYVRTLESLKSQYTREGKLEAALAVDAELKLMSKQLAAANNAGKGASSMQLVIVSVKIGDPKSNRLIDATRLVQKVLASGEASMKLAGGTLAPGTDPAPFVHKSVVVNYTILGERKEKVFADGAVVNFKTDLQ